MNLFTVMLNISGTYPHSSYIGVASDSRDDQRYIFAWGHLLCIPGRERAKECSVALFLVKRRVIALECEIYLMLLSLL